MYEDKRTILPSGLLSEATKPQYTPKPIVFNIPKGVKQGPNVIFPDKEKVAADARYAEQQAAQGEGGKIICTRCHQLGFMSDEIFAADDKYGLFVREYHPDFMAWYLHYAQPIVDKMHYNTLASRLFTKALWHLLVRPWSEQMAYESTRLGKGNKFGKFIMNTGWWLFQKSRHAKLAHA